MYSSYSSIQTPRFQIYPTLSSKFIRTCRGLEDAHFARLHTVVQGLHELQLDVVGRIGMEEAPSPLEAVHVGRSAVT